MPYKKRRYRRKKTTKKGCIYKVAKLALRRVNTLRKAQEVKYHDWSFNITDDLDLSGNLYKFDNVNTITKGTKSNERIGDDVTLIGLEYKGYFLQNSAGNTTVYIMLILNKENVVAGLDDVLDVSLIGPTGVMRPQAPYRQDTRHKFRILKRFAVNLQDGMLDNVPKRYFIKFKAKRKYVIDSDNVETNSLEMLYIANDEIGSTNPRMYGYIRLYYVDD